MNPYSNLSLALLTGSCLVLGACDDGGATGDGPQVTSAGHDRSAASGQPDDHTAESADGTFTVTWTSSPDPIPVGSEFSLDVQITPNDPAIKVTDVQLSADAWMPEHAHGMNIAPSIGRTGPGMYKVEGMLFHMPGFWRLFVDLTEGGITERAQFDLQIE